MNKLLTVVKKFNLTLYEFSNTKYCYGEEKKTSKLSITIYGIGHTNVWHAQTHTHTHTQGPFLCWQRVVRSVEGREEEGDGSN